VSGPLNVTDGQCTSVDLHSGGSQPEQLGENSDCKATKLSTNLASSSKPSGKGPTSLVNSTVRSDAPQWEEPPQQLLSPAQTPSAASPSPSPVVSATPQATGKTSQQAKLVAHSQLKPEKADASSNQSVDPVKAKALVDAEWKAKSECCPRSESELTTVSRIPQARLEKNGNTNWRFGNSKRGKQNKIEQGRQVAFPSNKLLLFPPHLQPNRIRSEPRSCSRQSGRQKLAPWRLSANASIMS
jgi:hypothetical protein